MAKVLVTGLTLFLLAVGGMITGCSCSSSPESPLPTQVSYLQAQSPLITSTSSAPGAAASPIEVHPQIQPPAATPPASEGTALPVEVPSEVPFPEAGKASVGGVLYTFSGNGPIPETVFYLTPAKGESNRPPLVLVGPREESGDVRGMSDAQGRIVLNNVPAGSYYLAVWAPYNWILAAESDTDSTPRLIVLEPGQRENLGVIYVAWP